MQVEDRKVNWRRWKQEKKAEKKKWKELNLLKKLEKQRVRELAEKQAKEEQQQQQQQEEDKGRHYTLSVALPGSILNNAQSLELRTYLAGQIARACAIFCVDEIVVFDEYGEDAKSVEGEFEGIGKRGKACVQLARILQYLECPQYLRKSFFPKHGDLQFAGLLNPLDSPHHMRVDEDSEYREGVVLDRPSKPGRGSFVNCGMKKKLKCEKAPWCPRTALARCLACTGVTASASPPASVLSFQNAHSRKATISPLGPQSGVAPWTRSLSPPLGTSLSYLEVFRAWKLGLMQTKTWRSPTQATCLTST
ncbi:putative methyltransferase C9orf114 homolog isoform X2 [Cyrtonyx montezumae]|uniref:putative methyltransferase C9orf114 homolog isoform X2 n=1 Tax=Cyrtonyx montezumae TaxID=9017 RepID=UPI0032DAB57B